MQKSIRRAAVLTLLLGMASVSNMAGARADDGLDGSVLDRVTWQPAGEAPQLTAAERELQQDWQALPTDLNGLRHSGKWTIQPNGVQTASPAAASDCASGYICFFQDGNFGGLMARVTPSPSATPVGVGSGFDNSMSSWINRSSLNAAWYPDSGTNAGTEHCVPHGIQVSQVLPAENDTMSSYRVFGDSHCAP